MTSLKKMYGFSAKEIKQLGIDAAQQRAAEKNAEKAAKISEIYTMRRANDPHFAKIREQPRPRSLFRHYWYDNEICLLFAPNNAGKTIFAYQIADLIANRGHTVAYFDYELTEAQWLHRYTTESGEIHHFSPNLWRASINYPTDVESASEAAKMLLEGLQLAIESCGAKIIVIDNVTRIVGDLTDGKVAFELMGFLDRLKKEKGYSILMLGHTRKGSSTDPHGISSDASLGSSLVQNFVDSSFAIGKNAANPSTVYVKQIKARACEKIDDVEVYEIAQIKGFLHFDYVGVSTEREQLRQLDDETAEERRLFVIAEYERDSTLSLREIARRVNEHFTQTNSKVAKCHATTVKRIIERYISEQQAAAQDGLPSYFQADSNNSNEWE